jgi:hypothetical protein
MEMNSGPSIIQISNNANSREPLVFNLILVQPASWYFNMCLEFAVCATLYRQCCSVFLFGRLIFCANGAKRTLVERNDLQRKKELNEAKGFV